jgi:hypothetical protein
MRPAAVMTNSAAVLGTVAVLVTGFFLVLGLQWVHSTPSTSADDVIPPAAEAAPAGKAPAPRRPAPSPTGAPRTPKPWPGIGAGGYDQWIQPADPGEYDGPAPVQVVQRPAGNAPAAPASSTSARPGTRPPSTPRPAQPAPGTSTGSPVPASPTPVPSETDEVRPPTDDVAEVVCRLLPTGVEKCKPAKGERTD